MRAERTPRIDLLALASPAAAAPAAPGPFPWGLALLRGRLCEVSGTCATAVLTVGLRLVAEAQRLGEPAAWITDRRGTFFPPDAASNGVDLEALAVVLAPGGGGGCSRAGELLVRSGGFGIVVMDLGAGDPSRSSRLQAPRGDAVPPAIQSRLAGLAKRHGSAVVFLTEKAEDRPSLGPLIGLRAEARRLRERLEAPGIEVRVLKDKRRGGGQRHVEPCHGPPGLT